MNFTTMDVLKKLKSLNESVPSPIALATLDEVDAVEKLLNIHFPPSYKRYLLEYSDVNFGVFELYNLRQDGSYLDIVLGIREAREAYDLPNYLIPFLHDNSNYFCFDKTSKGPEYNVVYWAHNGLTNEKWDNFLDWVVKCWINENQ